MVMRKIYIFDTTLRDGEQSPGVSLSPSEKLQIAQQLQKLGVDVIEAGFPIASQGDFEAVKAVAENIKGTKICALARTKREDIEAAYKALKGAERPRIHTFIATSKVHLEHKLRMSPQEVLERVRDCVSFAKSLVPEVEFSCEDATRTDKEFLLRVIDVAIECGADIINIPDTVGYITPSEFSSLIKEIRARIPSSVLLSVHCHNDLGLAVANSLAAILSGADQVECTINGIGERAGNAALEEIVMALYTRQDLFSCRTDIKTEQIYRTSRLVSKLTGMEVQPNKAIVGENAFKHQAGIHQDGVLKEERTYHIMDATLIGLPSPQIVLGKLSGRHAFKEKLKELGYTLGEEEFEEAFLKFKALADKKKRIFDEDIVAIVEDSLYKVKDVFELDYINVVTGNRTVPTATVRIKKEGKLLEEAACGNGPVDATYKAIDRITGINCTLLDYSIKAISSQRDAIGEVRVKVSFKGKTLTGIGASTDIIEASAKAYLNAINKGIHLWERQQ